MTFAMNRFSKSVTLDTAPQMPAGDTGAAAKADLGKLPEWNLADLYPSAESNELKADLEKAAKDAANFETRWKGKLGEEAAKANGGNFAEAIKEYEALSELMGRIASFAGLYYYGDTTDPKRMKLFGDVQQKLTDANTPLIFFSLEINRIDDAVLEKAMASNPAIGHYRPWLEDLRLDKPYELDDKLEQLFHEKSITGYSAWNRLFDETMSSLRFEVDGEELAIEQTLNMLQDADGAVRKRHRRRSPRLSAQIFASSR